MAKKKSSRIPAERFISECAEITEFLEFTISNNASDKHISWAHEYAIMKLYREFEQMLLECLIAGLNRNTSALSDYQGFEFPKNLTDEVCEYVIIGNGYFDFKGQKEIVNKCKRFVGENNFLTTVLKDPSYKDTSNKLLALRNYAAHDSSQSKKRALDSIGAQRIGTAGSYLKTQGRCQSIISEMRSIAQRIAEEAPY